MRNAKIVILLTGFIALFASCEDTSGCPMCTDDLKQDAVLSPATTPTLYIPMRWTALSQAPTIEDPMSVCSYNLETVLDMRSYRAAACVWYPQCRISLTEGWSNSNVDYTTFEDADLSVGEPGDVVILSNGNGGWNLSEEGFDLAWECYNHWETEPGGILAMHIRRFVLENGNPISIRGIAYPNSESRPFLMIVDPQFIPSGVDAEHVLAHEIGHLLGLCHTDEGCNVAQSDFLNLMQPQGNESMTELDANQCNLARQTGVLIGGDLQAGFNDFTKGAPNNFPASEGRSSLDLTNVVVKDRIGRQQGFEIHLGTNGLRAEKAATYWLTLNTDNNSQTGLNSGRMISGASHIGTDMIIKTTIGKEGNIENTTVYMARNNQFQPVTLPPSAFTVSTKTISLYTYSDEGCGSDPAFEEISVKFSQEALSSLGISSGGQQAFPAGLEIQAVSEGLSASGEIIRDFCPNAVSQIELSPCISRKGVEVRGN